MTKLNNKTRELNIDELNTVSGGVMYGSEDGFKSQTPTPRDVAVAVLATIAKILYHTS